MIQLLKQNHSNFLSIPYADSSFDFVVTSFAFHYLTDEQKLLALGEMRRVLKPHGRICITDIMFENKQKQAEYAENLKSNGQSTTIELIENGHPAILTNILDWFEQNQYITKHRQVNKLFHIVYAVPI
ncbi:class I SAM-dependent methyltransferase [Aneurinibacillus terranovensis]|uniref:class I SAM-dependent methyltransferase n=1 Tax=Aneurinibacillus terranovensis TaxID=278991 RepID=UPI0003FDCE48|nr:class I SAM-dependent methyltransferase [Aneurinibacillus terranovensis]